MKKQSKWTKLFCLGAAVFILVMSIWIGVLISKDKKLGKELTDKEALSVQMDEENAALEALVNEDNETAFMEQYARKSGYVYPDERVYIDGN